MNWIQNHLNKHKKALEAISEIDIETLIDECVLTLKAGKNIFVIGNGGSAANASHFAEDLGKGANDAIHENAVMKVAKEFSVPFGYFKVFPLTDSVPYITAIGNDYSFDDIFVKQLEPLASRGDLLIGISVSGTSPNLVKAFKWANKNYLGTVALTGKQAVKKVNSIHALADLSINIAEEHYAIVEDLSMTILHMVVYYIMEKMQ